MSVANCCVQLDRIHQVLELIRQSQIHQETWQKVRLFGSLSSFYLFLLLTVYLCNARIIKILDCSQF